MTEMSGMGYSQNGAARITASHRQVDDLDQGARPFGETVFRLASLPKRLFRPRLTCIKGRREKQLKLLMLEFDYNGYFLKDIDVDKECRTFSGR